MNERFASTRLHCQQILFEPIDDTRLSLMGLAQDEAKKFGQSFVGTEHILIALLRQRTTLAAKALYEVGVSLENARVIAMETVGRGSGLCPVELPLTPRSRKILDRTWEISRELGSNSIRSGHALLAILQETEGVAYAVLSRLRADVSFLEKNVLESLRATATAEPPVQSPYPICPSCQIMLPDMAISCRICGYGISPAHYVDCQFCKQRIRKGALKCRHCLRLVDR